MAAPRPFSSVDRVLVDVMAAIEPRAVQAVGTSARRLAPLAVAPFATGLVSVCRLAMAQALGPLVALGSHFFEFLVDVGA
jgi:hypothetical protein